MTLAALINAYLLFSFTMSHNIDSIKIAYLNIFQKPKVISWELSKGKRKTLHHLLITHQENSWEHHNYLFCHPKEHVQDQTQHPFPTRNYNDLVCHLCHWITWIRTCHLLIVLKSWMNKSSSPIMIQWKLFWHLFPSRPSYVIHAIKLGVYSISYITHIVLI